MSKLTIAKYLEFKDLLNMTDRRHVGMVAGKLVEFKKPRRWQPWEIDAVKRYYHMDTYKEIQAYIPDRTVEAIRVKIDELVKLGVLEYKNFSHTYLSKRYRDKRHKSIN